MGADANAHKQGYGKLVFISWNSVVLFIDASLYGNCLVGVSITTTGSWNDVYNSKMEVNVSNMVIFTY